MINYQISPLIIKDPQNKFRSEIFINEEEIDKKGSLILLVEIESNKNEALDLLTNFLQISYLAYKQSIGLTPEKILEDILHQLNQQLGELPQKEREWYKKINAIVGLLFETTLHFSAVGNIKAYLIRQAQFTDLVKEKIDSQGPLKIFTTIISGELYPDDAFLFTTPVLFDYIAEEKIRKFITTLPPLSATENLKNLLANVSLVVNFLVIIVKQRSNLRVKTPRKIISYQTAETNKITAAEQSLNTLLEKQKETAKIISTPSFFQTIFSKIKELFLKIKISKKQTSLLKLSVVFLISNLIRLIKFLLLAIYQILIIIFRLIGPKKRRQDALSLLNQKFTTFFNYLKNLSKVKKVVLLIFLICLLVLSQNLIYQSRKKYKSITEKNFQNSLIQIKNYQDTIEAALIYNDQARAQETLITLVNTIKSLPENTKERIAKIDELNKATDILIQRVWKLVKISEPVELINLNLPVNQPAAEVFGFINNELVIFSNNKYWSSSLKQINLNQGDLNPSLEVTGGVNLPLDNFFMVWTKNNKIYTWVKNKTLEEKSIQYSPTFKNITSLSLYRKILYILDKNANQIYKHNPSGENFGPGLPWVKEPVISLTNGISLAIDGNLYVLEEGGQIQKFLLGKKQDFPKISIYPSLDNPKKIFTDPNTNNIYILDPENKRIVVLNKNGELINQYSSDRFDNLKDFVVLEKEKKVYLLNDNKVYVISIF